MNYKNLKKIRVVFAVLFFLLMLAPFLRSTADWHTDFILKTQFVPSLLSVFSGGVLAFLLLLVLTMLFGRVYCSFLCPLGILQDAVSRISAYLRPAGKNAAGKPVKKRIRYGGYRPPHNRWRYGILIVTGLCFAAGITYPLALLDPYSNFGKIAGQLFGNAELSLLNGLSEVFPSVFYYQQYTRFVFLSFLYALLFFGAILAFSAFRGRLYCNTVCPVGSLLGLLGSCSLFRPVIDKNACIRCRACSERCKSNCIDLEKKEIDLTRCVVCFDCMTSCSRNGITLQPVWKHNRQPHGQANGPAGADPHPSENTPPENRSRRNALIAAGALGSAMLAKGLSRAEESAVPGRRNRGEGNRKTGLGIAPPGAQSIRHLKETCTACHACIAACPNGIIRPATLEYGIDGFMLPTLKYQYKFCAYDCNTCSQVCPQGALIPLTLPEKQLTRIGAAHFYRDNCIIVKDGTDCGACDEHCPTKAITMQPFQGGLLLPRLNRQICIGCGGCEYVCPATPKAMIVAASPVQRKAQPPTVEKQEKIQVDDFGF